MVISNEFTVVGLGTHLFINVPRPGDSETFSYFESSCHLLLPI